jgi:outer membrane protein assembly factor BamB
VTRLAALALVLVFAACSTQDNLGNHVFGEARWSIGLGSTADDRATAIALHPNGDVIVVGTCGGPIDFGRGMIACEGSFVTRRDAFTGDEVWTHTFDGLELTSVGIDMLGNVSAIGKGEGDQVIVVLSPEGDLQVLQHQGVIGDAIAPFGAVASDGCVFVTGGFQGAIPTSQGMIESAGVDGFLSSHFANGAVSWNTVLRGPGDQRGIGVAFTPDQALAVLVDATGSFTAGGTEVDTPAPSSILARFDLTGTLEWSRPLGDSGALRRLGVTSVGDLVVAGDTLRVIESDGTERWSARDADLSALAIAPNDTIIAGGRESDVEDGELVLVAYTPRGEVLSMLHSTPAPSLADSRIEAVATDDRGVVAFAVTAARSFDFGNGKLQHSGMRDIAIVKLRSPSGGDDPIVLTRPGR